MRRKRPENSIDRNSSVAVELKKFDCGLIKKYSGFLNCILEGFRDAEYSLEDISEGFKSIGMKVTPEYILKHTIGPLDEDKVIVSYYRCGYSVNSISKSFNRPVSEVQELIRVDEDLRINHHEEWLKKASARITA